LAVTAPSTISGYGTIPIGVIVMWSGTIANIPTGWALCNGSNGTPNLTNKFIVGAHNGVGIGTSATAGPGFSADNGILTDNYTPGNFGGETSHQLSIPELASHTHTLVPNLEVPQSSASGMIFQNNILQGDGGNKRTHTIIQDPSPIVTTVGGSKYHENRSPYYALAFIMRTS
jgi:microcystin-dependent protein